MTNSGTGCIIIGDTDHRPSFLRKHGKYFIKMVVAGSCVHSLQTKKCLNTVTSQQANLVGGEIPSPAQTIHKLEIMSK